MTLRHLRIFVSVCDHKSVTEAANSLHLAQPTVTLVIKELENYYSIRLFDRISRRLFITEAGRKFYDYAVHIVALFDEMEVSMKDWDGAGIVRVGASVTIGNFFLPRFVKKFKQDHPEMKVQVCIRNSGQLEQLVLDNALDFAFVEGKPSFSQILAVPFLDDHVVAIVEKEHPLAERKEISLKELTAWDLILREKGSAGREILDSLFTLHGLKGEPAWESVSTQAIVKAVKAGLGVSVLPYMQVEREIRNGEVAALTIQEEVFERKFYVIRHKNKYLARTAREFMEMAVREAEETKKEE